MTFTLIVDDEVSFAAGMAEFLRCQGHTVACADNLSQARDHLERKIPDVLLLDLMLPDGSGLQLFENFRDHRPKKIVIITGHSGVKSLIKSMVGDGVVYMKKPVEPRELIGVINSVVNTIPPPVSGALVDVQGLHYGVMAGESQKMHRLYEEIGQVGPTDSTVLIQGESGTGKELVADAIHKVSGRSGSFVPVNCGGLSQELVSTQLFGHEKGSFTGANKRHVGFFERAHQGTLFLDEITEMPLEMQTHLLRVLETGNVLRVGAEREFPVDVRLVAATNRDPVQAIREKTLREDLYFRLRVFPIKLPALRERQGDIGLLAERFLEELNKRHQTTKILTNSALEALEKHSWPGNVRELKHIVHRAYIMSVGDSVQAPERFEEDLPGEVQGLGIGRSIADVERDLILATLEHLEGDKRAAAASLGISLKTLYNRMKEYEEQ